MPKINTDIPIPFVYRLAGALLEQNEADHSISAIWSAISSFYKTANRTEKINLNAIYTEQFYKLFKQQPWMHEPQSERSRKLGAKALDLMADMCTL
jgi:hypothetical protein